MSPDPLKIVLERYSRAARPLTELEPLGNAGGHSGARLWKYRSALGLMVARAWPVETQAIDLVRRIHTWLALARPLGFVAIPIEDRAGCTAQEVGGRIWEIAPWMPGAPFQERPVPPALIHAGFAGLARLHQALSDQTTLGPPTGLATRLREIEDLVAGGFDVMDHAVGPSDADHLREPARRWLNLARLVAPRLTTPLRRALSSETRLQPCLRDARPDHFLFEGDRLTGLVDFGAMDLDVVSCDLARLLAEWIGPHTRTRSEALECYSRIRPLHESELTLVGLYEDSATLLRAARWVRWHFLEGRVFEDPEAVGNGIGGGLNRLAELAAALRG